MKLNNPNSINSYKPIAKTKTIWIILAGSFLKKWVIKLIPKPHINDASKIRIVPKSNNLDPAKFLIIISIEKIKRVIINVFKTTLLVKTFFI